MLYGGEVPCSGAFLKNCMSVWRMNYSGERARQGGQIGGHVCSPGEQ